MGNLIFDVGCGPADLLDYLPKFDLVIASGLLNHLDDIEVSNIMRLGCEELKLSRRMITIDPYYVLIKIR